MGLPDQAVAALAAPDPAVVQPIAPLLVDGDPAAQHCGLGRAQVAGIELDAQVAGQRHRGAKIHALAAASGVRRRRAHMRAHHLGREELQVAALNCQPRQRVDVVAGPDPVAVAQHRKVDTAAAARAAFDLNAGVGRAQPRQQGVDRMHLGPVAGQAAGQTGGGEVAVVVPFQVFDGVSGQQRRDLAEQVIRRLGPGDVQHQLVACTQQRPAGQLQRPIRMSTVELAVGVDHLGLDPQAEAHAQAVDMMDQITQALRELALVGPPVAQRGAVVVAAMEPAIVEHEALDAQRGGRRGQVLELVGLQIEVKTFPGVEVHRPRPHGAAGPVQPRAQLGMEVGRQTVEALVRAAGHDLGRDQAGPRQQPAFTRCQPLAQLPLKLAVMQPVDLLLVVARPGQVGAVDQAGMVGCAGQADHGAGKAIVRGAATPVLAPPLAARQRLVLLQKLMHVLAGPGAHTCRLAGQQQRAGGQPLHIQRRVTQVGQLAAHQQHIVLVQRQVDAQAQRRHAVLELDLHAALRQRPDQLATVKGLREIAAVAVRQQRALAEPADTEARRQRQRLVDVEVEAGQWPGGTQRRAGAGTVGQTRPPVAPDRRLASGQLQHQAAGAAVQHQAVGGKAIRGGGHGDQGKGGG